MKPENDIFDYEINEEDDTISIIGLSDGWEKLTEISIPEEINSKKVTRIEHCAFRCCETLTSVTIPNSVITIGSYAFFNCESIKSINIPDSVTTIAHCAFSKCISLKEVTIPSSVTTIGSFAFEGCASLKEIIIPNGVTTIKECAFAFCKSLKSVTIPNSVTEIDEYAFSGCTSLKSVVIPNSVTTIRYHAFPSECEVIVKNDKEEQIMENKLKSILFTHDDLDGAGCRIIWELWNLTSSPNHWDVVNCSNYSIDNDVINFINNGNYSDDTLIAFGDICPSKEVLETVIKKFKNVRIWDHHKTNLYVTEMLDTATIIPVNDEGVMECGTSLMFKAFSKYSKDTDNKLGFNYSNIYILVEMIRQYDTYDFKNTGFITPKLLMTLFKLCGMNNFVRKYVNKFSIEPFYKILDTPDNDDVKEFDNLYTKYLIDKNDLDFVKVKIENENRIIESFSEKDIINIKIPKRYSDGESSAITSLDKYYNVALLCKAVPCNISDLAYTFLTKHPEYDFMASFDLTNYGTFQFRTVKDDINLGMDIAQPIGGGGHPKAAGAPLNDVLKNKIIDIIISALNDINIIYKE